MHRVWPGSASRNPRSAEGGIWRDSMTSSNDGAVLALAEPRRRRRTSVHELNWTVGLAQPLQARHEQPRGGLASIDDPGEFTARVGHAAFDRIRGRPATR